MLASILLWRYAPPLICPTGMRHAIPGIPGIRWFSGTKYGNYTYTLPPVQTATYYHDGQTEVVAPDDPRLIRMLNFILYSFSNSLDVYETRYCEEEEIAEYLAYDAPYIEVTFCEPEQETEPDKKILSTRKIMIRGDCWMQYREHYDLGTVGVRRWPYGERVWDTQEDLHTYMSGGELWDNTYWIDIPAYCGF